MPAAAAPVVPRVQLLDPLACPDWDRDVSALPGAGFFHRQAWSRVLHDTYGFTPCSVVAHVGGHFTGVLPLVEVNSWLTGRRGISLPFADACEPAARDAATERQLVLHAWEHGRSRGWKYCEIRGAGASAEFPASISYYQHRLDLTKGVPGLLLGLDPSARRAVRKAEHSGLRVEFARDLAATRQFYELLCLTRRRHGLPPQPFRFFAQLQRHVLAARQGVIVLACLGDRPVAGALFLHSGRRALFKFGASQDEYQALRPNNLALWRAIEWHAQAGFEVLDFGRTDLHHEGLRRFKLGLGTRESMLHYVRRDLRHDGFARQNSQTSGWHNAIFRHLPGPISRAIGSGLYRHMA